MQIYTFSIKVTTIFEDINGCIRKTKNRKKIFYLISYKFYEFLQMFFDGGHIR